MTVLDQITATYARVHAAARPLFAAVIVWMVLSLIGEVLSAAYTPLPGTTNTMGESVLVFIGHVIAAYATLIGWYTAHRYLISGEMPDSHVPAGLRRDKKAFEFVMAQIRNVLLLLFISCIVIIPLTIYYSATYAAFITPEEAARIQSNIGLVAIPLFILFFSRLLLVAPLAARGELQAVSRSWKATKGHFVRINLLQVACLVPAVATILPDILRHFGQPVVLQVLAMVLSTIGSFYSIVLYTQLAEDEYKKLIT